MAQPYVSGPVPVFIGFYGLTPLVNLSGPPSASSISFLGHTRDGIELDWQHQFSPLRVDVAGEADFDSSYQGRTVTATMTLTRWNDAVYQLVHDVATGGVGGAPGVEDPGEVGTLMATEGSVVQLILPFPYTAKAPYASQVAGTRFFAAHLTTDNWRQLGTKPRELSLVFRCLRLFIPGVVNSNGAGRLLTYDNTVTGLPAVN